MKTFDESKEILDSFFKPLVEDEERGNKVRVIDMIAWNKLTTALQEEKIVEITTEKT